ncbi:Release factor glutamine methyltransferase [Arthrobacter ulcerisalmonis]|uniref:peptide chain release factor N(5)-glutamine methyltransferase n=1 Tax=Arthrobacter ulcerisalmonis TaxID=2483813 RepID=A0A3P5WB78_9MICC|nr:putative protein N(5)-glutamine methyltransferase [Arthrobacter ulcerisalmonis]VDC18441.1 Release factor glutamine methyltransferase [Arthrobacter ulcerisalmonis]
MQQLRPDVGAQIVLRLRAAGCVFAEDEAQLLVAESAGPEELESNVRRRVAGTPLEYILGWAAFAGQRIAVAPGVFVPRLRTELVVDLAAAALTRKAAVPGVLEPGPRTVVVDLCCGSGAVGAALALRFTGIELHAADIDPAAVACARQNLGPVGGLVHQGNLFEALPHELRGRVRVLAVNAPYVPTAAIETMPPEARLHEARACLDGGADGLDFHRLVARGAKEWLAPGGQVIIETSVRQAPATAAILASAGLAVQTVRSEELDGTAVVGTAGLEV